MKKRRVLGVGLAATALAGSFAAAPSGTASPPSSVEGSGWVTFTDFPSPGQSRTSS